MPSGQAGSTPPIVVGEPITGPSAGHVVGAVGDQLVAWVEEGV